MFVKMLFHKDGKYGAILYDESGHDVLVSHEDPKVRNIVHRYLTTKREFDVPTSHDPNVRGGYATVTKRAVDNSSLMGMALSEMHFNTHVSPAWGHKENIPYKDMPLDPNAPIDKSFTIFDLLGDGANE